MNMSKNETVEHTDDEDNDEVMVPEFMSFI